MAVKYVILSCVSTFLALHAKRRVDAAALPLRQAMSRRRAERVVPAVGNHHDGDFGVYMAHKEAKLHVQFSSDCA